VFNVTELLELVLLAVPVKDVLVLQRVCKDWQAAIEGSTRIQQALFRRPVSEVLQSPPGHLDVTKAGTKSFRSRWYGWDMAYSVAFPREPHLVNIKPGDIHLSSEELLDSLHSKTETTCPLTTNPFLDRALLPPDPCGRHPSHQTSFVWT
jgi:hypothetical protein